MIKKEEKQFAFVGCCRVCIFVAVGLLTLTFCVGDVRGDITSYEFDSEGNILFEKSVDIAESIFTDQEEFVSSFNPGYTYFNTLWFNEIGYYDNIAWIRFIPSPTSGVSWEMEDEPLGAQTTFVAKINSDVIGTGIISYTKNEASPSDVVIYLFFYYFDRAAYTGGQFVTLEYNRIELWKIRVNGGQVWAELPAGNEKFGFYVGSHVDIKRFVEAWDYDNGEIRVDYGGEWFNLLETTLFGVDYLNLNVTRSTKLSSWKIWTDVFEYANETSKVGDDFVVNVFEFPVYINVTDVWDNYHTATYELVPPPAIQLYGYVFDAANNFGIEGAFVEFQDQNMTTIDNGFYLFNSNIFGDSWLNLSKSGYQNFNKMINYTGDQRYDIFLTKNETVNEGTCTVAGIVTDVTSGEPILNALVWIKNTTFSSYRYTNANGYYVFYNLHNTTYTLSAEQDGYHKQQLDINLTDIDTAYYYDFALLAITDEEVPPTPTPKPPETLPEHVDNIFDMLGIEDWSTILASAVIMFMGGIFGSWSRFNPIVIMFGGFFGFLICIYMGLLPSWMLALVIVITVLLIVGVVSRKYVGDE